MNRNRLKRPIRRIDALFGNAWRAAPLLATTCVLVALGSSLLMLGYPLGFRDIVDGAAEHQPGRIVTGLIVVAVTFPGSWALQLTGGSLNAKLTDLANLRVGMRIGALASAAPYLEHFERPDYLAEIDNLRERRRTLAGAPAQTLGMVRSAIQFIGIAVLLGLVWPPLIVVPLLAAVPAWADRRGAQVEKRSDDDLADRRRLLGELFSLASTAAPARELRTFGITDALLARHARLGDEISSRALRAARTAAVWEAAGWIVYAAGFAIAIVALVLRAAHGVEFAWAFGRGAASPGAVVEVVSLLRRAQRQVTGASTSAGSFATASATATRLLWLEDYVAATAGAPSGTVPARLSDGIRFERVSFTYPGQDAATLRDLSVHLGAGSTVAIVGENGAGKSTLIKLLTGMYRPSTGRITVDGHDLADVSPQQWRTATTGAFQDYVRFFMSVGDGVGAGDLERIDERDAVLGAVRWAGADDLVAELPDGLDTLLGPYIGGRNLSGGQWQRLALARGLMRDRPLLIVLDEPTASLDAPSEAALFDRYRDAARRLGQANGAITVLVSHRFSTVHMADTIIVMDEGTIAESGDHASLMACQGVYAELFTLQAAGYS
ncbi:MAG: ABC transporter ATP-binding protein [Streptosporangiaceae bacterium]|nr:ABC transporter ATP-binding protein [Streptosporangiaceae bacterium]